MLKTSRTPKNVFILFSLYENSQNLLSTSQNSFNSFFGIRSISSLSIMFYHRYSKDFAHMDQEENISFLHCIIRLTRISVDTFMVMSATLQTISTLKAIDGKNFKIWKVVLRRYLRYTPAVMGAVIIIILLPHFIESPSNIYESEIHKNHLILFLFNINNFFITSYW